MFVVFVNAFMCVCMLTDCQPWDQSRYKKNGFAYNLLENTQQPMGKACIYGHAMCKCSAFLVQFMVWEVRGA
jgi:hypothetical protein